MSGFAEITEAAHEALSNRELAEKLRQVTEQGAVLNRHRSVLYVAAARLEQAATWAEEDEQPIDLVPTDGEPWYEFYTPEGDRYADTLVKLALVNGPLTAARIDVELEGIIKACQEAGHGEASDTACRESLAHALASESVRLAGGYESWLALDKGEGAFRQEYPTADEIKGGA